MDFEKAFASRIQFEGFSVDDAPSTLSDTIAAAFALVRREELSNSATLAWIGANEKRAKAISELGGSEQLARQYAFINPWVIENIRESELAGNREANPLWRGMLPNEKLALEQQLDFQQRFPDQVSDDQQLRDDFKAEAAELRKGEQFTLERGGGFGAFIGTAGAVMTDPLVLASLPFGVGAAGGRTLLATVGRTALIEGSIAAGIEIPIQAEVLRFKREIESPWSFKQSAINVLAAGFGGAAFAGTIRGGIEGTRTAFKSYRNLISKTDVTKNPFFDEAELRDAGRILEDTIAFHDQNPLGEFTEVLHERAFERARVQHADHQPVDISDDIIEPPDEINDVLRRSEDPAELVDIDPREVDIDAVLFQFKSGGDAAGVTDVLKGVTTFDRMRAGVSIIWERKDGKRFIVDGHQRRNLGIRAIEAGQDPAEVRLNGFILRESDGITALDARQMAAAKNIAEGSGSAVDAAKVFRAGGPMVEAMLPTLPPNSALVRQGRGLAALGEDEFLQVVNGVIEERFGAMIGNATADAKLQQAMIQVIRRTQPANETQARAIIDQVKVQGVEVRVTEDLFGAQAIAESLYLERAQVLDAALREARKDRTVFGRLVSEEARITEAGENVLDRDANMQRIQEANDATAQISQLANAKGPISEALQQAASQVKAGKSPAAASAAFLQAARREILANNSRRLETRRARPGRDQAGAEGGLDPSKGHPVRLSERPPNERAAALTQLVRRQADLDIGAIYAKAQRHQKALLAEAKKIAAELGDDVELVDAGIKIRKQAEAKLTRKGIKAGELTDVIRLGFLVRTPELVARIIDRLADRFEVLDQGVTVTGMGYVDHTALVRFADGRVGEVQLWDPEMARAKFGAGGDIYKSVRNISDEELARDPALAQRVEQAAEDSKDLYASALAAASDEWRRVAMMVLPEDMRVRVQALLDTGGSAGAPGKVLRKALRDISEPDSKISIGEARDQVTAPEATKKPSRPPTVVSRTTAGRASQLKNLSAIDAAPRKIVRLLDDARTSQPDASRTGTVPDTEYDAVMAKLNDLIEERGQLATVTREIGGEIEQRSASAVIEELDVLEETLERIRLCSRASRSVA